MKMLFLHIGAPKTGTTAIQSFLVLNSRLLESSFDLSMPRQLSPSRAAAMHVYATQTVSRRKRSKLRFESLAEFSREYEARIEAIGRTMTTTAAICSNELLFSLDKKAIDRLKRPLSSVFASIRVILYLRRQDHLETAAYLQAFKGGYDHLPAFDRVLKRRRPSYLAAIDAWSTIFGSDSVQIFLYDDVMREERDIIRHFMHSIGVTDLSAFAKATRTNRSWGLYQACTSKAIRQTHKDVPLRRVNAFVETVEAGPRYPVPRAEAIAFYRSFAEENEIIRNRYFPHKASLFDQDFTMYPETFDIDAATRAYSTQHLLEQYNAQMRSHPTHKVKASNPFKSRRWWKGGP